MMLRLNRTLGYLLVGFVAPFGLSSEVNAAELDVTLGRESVVFPDGYHGMRYFPDEPIVVLKTRPFTYFLVDTDKTVLMRGSTLDNSTPVGVVLDKSGGQSFDADYAGVSSAYYDEKIVSCSASITLSER